MHRRPLVAALEFGVHSSPEATSGMGEAVGAAIPRLFHRQRVLLSLLSAVGGRMGESDVQRLLFDYGRRCRARHIDPPYDFIADEHGPRSFTAVADRDKLASRGILVSGTWHLTSEGHRLARSLKNRDVSVFAARFRSRGPGDPGTGGNRRPPAAHRDRNGAARDNAHSNGGLLATIGYEGRSYEAYFSKLLESGISRLCDVRRNPLSRKWGFSKRLLSQGCDELGIRYESFRELGIESGARANLGDRAAYERLFAEYEATTLPRCRDAVGRIAGWIDAGERVAITCYERDSGDCHRSRLAGAIVATAAGPLRPKHL